MNWSIIDLRVGDYIKCKSEAECKEFEDFLFTYGFVAERGHLKNNYRDDEYWLKVTARWLDTKNFK